MGDQVLCYASPHKCDRFAEACKRGDEQGIPFSSPEIQLSRQHLRIRRLQTYPSFRNEQYPLDEENQAARVSATHFLFQANYADAPLKQEHFQLRNCVRVAENDVIYMTGKEHGEVSSYDLSTQTKHIILSGSSNNFMRVTTFSVMDDLLATGGLHGQLNIDTLSGEPRVHHWLSEEQLGHITNSVDWVRYRGAKELMVGSNNRAVSFYDPENLSVPKRTLATEFNVNRVSLSPDQSLVAFVADEIYGHVVSTDSMSHLYTLDGHKDYGFGVSWHPLKPHLLATGNQDRSIRVWDLRAASNSVVKPLVTIFGEMTSVLNTEFSADGEYLVASEAADYLHIVDGTLFREVQTVDFFGEVMGIAFSKEAASAASLFVGIHDSTYSSLMEFRPAKYQRWENAY